MNKIIVLCRDVKHQGGVVNYIKSTVLNIDDEDLCVEHFTIGRRITNKTIYEHIFTTLRDWISFYFKLHDNSYKIVHLNPSFACVPLLRDSIFLLIARMRSRKTLVFWHGWKSTLESSYDKKYSLPRVIFRMLYNQADVTIVLASRFKEKLLSWHFDKKIICETTSFDESLLKGFNYNEKLRQIKSREKLVVLYLSRLELDKGILETIDAFSSISIPGRDLELLIAGDGPARKVVERKLQSVRDNRIKFMGYIRGDQKIQALQCSHVMCLPTRYGEGLPVSILEAMAFGLVVVTLPTGGIPDIITNRINGYFIPSISKDEYSSFLKMVLSSNDELAKISQHNSSIAIQKFSSTAVSNRMKKIYKEMLA